MASGEASRFGAASRLGQILRILVAVMSCLVISGSLYLIGLFLITPNAAEEWTIGRRPNQYFTDFKPEQRILSDQTYGAIFGVAHNSGGSIEAILDAQINGADIIEADVVELDGVLYVAHKPPLLFLGQRWFRGPRLDHAWAAASGADAVMLDLKESSPGYAQLVGDFLEYRSAYRQVIVSSRSHWVLRYLRERLPNAILLMSVPDEAGLTAMQNDALLMAVIDGITVRHTVLTTENAAWLVDHDLLIFAWTVNDLERANELIRMGVDGITSDNLAIVSLFGGETQGEQELRPRSKVEGRGA